MEKHHFQCPKGMRPSPAGGRSLCFRAVQHLVVEWGAGSDFQRRNPAIQAFIENFYLRGLCFKHRSIWPRADFLSRPDLTPAAHGCTEYCETGLVWEQQDLQGCLGMFPYFGPRDYFDAPPVLG